MANSEFTLDETLLEFLENYEEYGFTDQSDIIAVALERLKNEMEESE